MVTGSHIGFDLDNIRPPTKPSDCWSEVLIGFIVSEILRFLPLCMECRLHTRSSNEKDVRPSVYLCVLQTREL